MREKVGLLIPPRFRVDVFLTEEEGGSLFQIIKLCMKGDLGQYRHTLFLLLLTLLTQ